MHGDGDGDRRGIVREYRRRRKASRARTVFFAIVMGNCVLQLTRHDTVPYRYKLPVLALIAAVWVWGVLATLRALTSVDADGVTVRGAFRARRRAWHDIYDLRVEPRQKQARADARWWTWLYDNDGRRFLLPNVDDWQLPDLRAEIDDLRSVAAEHRGMPWEPRPAVEARIRERAARHRAWVRATSGSLYVFLAAFLYLLWRIVVGGEPHPFLLLVCVPLASFVLFAALFHWLGERIPGAHA
ncbi:PH domain-containing protein [Streptomyces sp. NPDC101175]|uniref:PH domain-containing protein n=1 Tax=Streptomyces sp. NPDC101175 TaxID=3366123 RepID=UPI003838A868